jgi:hypothetical protein
VAQSGVGANIQLLERVKAVAPASFEQLVI